jgi:hypothetical protein
MNLWAMAGTTLAMPRPDMAAIGGVLILILACGEREDHAPASSHVPAHVGDAAPLDVALTGEAALRDLARRGDEGFARGGCREAMGYWVQVRNADRQLAIRLDLMPRITQCVYETALPQPDPNAPPGSFAP